MPHVIARRLRRALLAPRSPAPAAALDEQRADVQAFIGEMAGRHGFAAAELDRRVRRRWSRGRRSSRR